MDFVTSKVSKLEADVHRTLALDHIIPCFLPASSLGGSSTILFVLLCPNLYCSRCRVTRRKHAILSTFTLGLPHEPNPTIEFATQWRTRRHLLRSHNTLINSTTTLLRTLLRMGGSRAGYDHDSQRQSLLCPAEFLIVLAPAQSIRPQNRLLEICNIYLDRCSVYRSNKCRGAKCSGPTDGRLYQEAHGVVVWMGPLDDLNSNAASSLCYEVSRHPGLEHHGLGNLMLDKRLRPLVSNQSNASSSEVFDFVSGFYRKTRRWM